VAITTLLVGITATAGVACTAIASVKASPPEPVCTMGIIPFEDGSFATEDSPVKVGDTVIADGWVVDDYRIADTITTDPVTGFRTLHSAWAPGYDGIACTLEVRP
jgi:hypothetical protein